MEGFGGSGLSGMSGVNKRRRSVRRPRLDSHLLLEGRDLSPPSSTPSPDNAIKQSPDENVGYNPTFRRKEFNLNNSSLSLSSVHKFEGIAAPKKIKKDDRTLGEFDGLHANGSSRGGLSGNSEQSRNGSDLKRCSEGVLALSNWKSTSKVKENLVTESRRSDGYVAKSGDGHNHGQTVGAPNGSAENKLRKVKLKVGGVTRTIHANSNLETGNNGSSSANPSVSSDASQHRPKLILQNNSDDDHSSLEKGSGLQGVSWKDFGGGSSSRGTKEDSRGKVTLEGLPGKHTDKPHSTMHADHVRKSKRVPKRRVLDGEFDDGDEDDEIRYLEKLKISKVGMDYSGEYEVDGEDSAKKRKISKVSKSRKIGYDIDEDFGLSRSTREARKKSRSGRESEYADYVEEDELGSDAGPDAKRIKHKKESVESSPDAKIEPLTTRQRALQSGKGASSGNGESLIEFPNGLPSPPPRKQKEKLSEVEQQLKKAEAAQRRKIQVEKAARESEAEAIRKILGQDSSRKKREDKLRKQREELAQARAASFLTLASNTVRWVMGPTGTVVTFSEDVGLPSIFDSKPCCYPPPREKCVGPSCTNAYKYRDSKSNLPLCSLQCYRAIQGGAQAVTTS